MFGLAVARKKVAVPLEQRARTATVIPLPSGAAAYEQRATPFGCDIVQTHRANEDRLVFALIDVAGDRSRNALIAELVTQVFQSTAVELFTAADLNASEALSQLAQNLNRGLMARGARFAAAFLACYEGSTGALWYINAGHTPGLAYDGTFHELGATGVPFGLFSHAIHDAQITVLRPGGTFVLLSKGVIEMRVEKRQFGLEGAKRILANGSSTADELVSAVLDATEASADRRRLGENDRTVVALIR